MRTNRLISCHSEPHREPRAPDNALVVPSSATRRCSCLSVRPTTAEQPIRANSAMPRCQKKKNSSARGGLCQSPRAGSAAADQPGSRPHTKPRPPRTAPPTNPSREPGRHPDGIGSSLFTYSNVQLGKLTFLSRSPPFPGAGRGVRGEGLDCLPLPGPGG